MEKNKNTNSQSPYNWKKDKHRRAAIIPYYYDDSRDALLMLFMKPSNPKFGGAEFQLAKGRVDPGENEKEAAIREGGEELGLFRGNILKILDLGTFLGYTRVYLAKIKDPNLFGDPHFETGETKWMTPPEFIASGRTIHRLVVKAAVRRLGRKSQLSNK